jgi:hypothetical protein
MNDVSEYVNVFYKDTRYIIKVDEDFKRVVQVPSEREAGFRFGISLLILTTKVDLRLLSDSGKFRPCRLFLFQGLILVCEIRTDTSRDFLFIWKTVVKDRVVRCQYTTVNKLIFSWQMGIVIGLQGL